MAETQEAKRPSHWVNCKGCGTLVEVPHREDAPETCAHCPRREDDEPELPVG